MIYVLVQDREGYDDCDKPIFAHTTKEVVEVIHDKLVEHHQRMHRLAKQIQDDVKKLQQFMPCPPEPKYAELPKRPLVWAKDKWENAYYLEYLEVARRHQADVEKETDILYKKYAEYYQLPLEDIKSTWGHLYDRSYSIQEIEDNPEVDIRKL